MKKKMSEQEAFLRVAGRCSATEYSSADIETKLKKMDLSAVEIRRVIEKLQEENYLNEARFCKAFVADKLRYARWGRIKIGHALKMKGVGRSSCCDALNEIDDEEYFDILYSLLSSKNKALKAENDFERRGKLMRFALGRGFEMEWARRATEKIIGTADDEDD